MFKKDDWQLITKDDIVVDGIGKRYFKNSVIGKRRRGNL
jgi:hypothetical protein